MLSDVLILLEVKEAWLLRVVPNVLYYSVWIPYVWSSHISTLDKWSVVHTDQKKKKN